MANQSITKTKETVDLPESTKNLINSIEKMSVLELSELVKALEDKFGVVAAAPISATALGSETSDDNNEADKKDEVTVTLTSCGDKKIKVLKAIREVTDLGLKEAKEMVDNPPKAVKENIPKEEAEKIKKLLEEEGAEVEIK